MAINVSRDPRRTEFWQEKTPAAVGPGVYYRENPSQFDHKRDASAPFHST